MPDATCAYCLDKGERCIEYSRDTGPIYGPCEYCATGIIRYREHYGEWPEGISEDMKVEIMGRLQP